MSKKTKILIVEDETPLAMYMVSILTRFNCDVTVARNGRKAVELASERRYDLITLDIELADTTGFEICSDLKERHISYRTPIIFISASVSEKDMLEARKRGAVDYLPKPFDPTEFIYKVVYYARAQHLVHQETEAISA